MIYTRTIMSISIILSQFIRDFIASRYCATKRQYQTKGPPMSVAVVTSYCWRFTIMRNAFFLTEKCLLNSRGLFLGEVSLAANRYLKPSTSMHAR